MIKPLLLLLSVFFLIFFKAFSQQSSTYSNSFHNIGSVVNSFIDNDGKYVSCSNSSAYGDLVVTKTNPEDGSVIYVKEFDLGPSDYVIASAMAANGDYLFLSNINSTAGFIVTRITSGGTILWNELYNSSNSTFPQFIKETPAGDILIGGYVYDGPWKALAVKLTSQGVLNWMKIYDGTLWDNTLYDVEFIGTDYLFVGQEGYSIPANNEPNGLVYRTNSSGVILDAHDMDPGDATFFKKIVKRNDGGFIIAGETVGVYGGNDVLLAGYDSTGVYEWSHVYGGLLNENISDITKVGASEFVIAGFSKSVNVVSNIGWFFKISSSGYLIWSKVVGGDTENDVVKSVTAMSNDNLMLSVENESGDAPFQLFKTTEFGETSCGMLDYTPFDDTISLNWINNSIITSIGSLAVSSIVPVEYSSAYYVTQKCQLSFVEPKVYQKIIVAPNDDRINDIKETLDGGVIAVGYTKTGVHGGKDIFAVRMDSKGDTLWTKFYGTLEDDDTDGVLVKSDGGFLIMNNLQNTLINIDENGQVVSSKTFDGQIGASKISATTDNKIIIGSQGGKLLKLDDNLNVEWQKEYAIDFFINDVCEATNGDYLLCGNITGSPDRIGLMRLDNNGNVQWFKSFGELNSTELGEEGNSIIETVNGELIVSGITTGGFGYPYWFIPAGILLKLSSDGNFISAKTLDDGSLVIGYEIEKSGNGIYIAGRASNNNVGTALLAKIDDGLNVVWSKTYGTYLPTGVGDEFETFEPMLNGSFVLGGATNRYGNGTDEFYMVKTDSLGNSNHCHQYPLTLLQEDIILAEQNEFTSVLTTNVESSNETLEGNLGLLVWDLNFEVNSTIVNNLCNGSSNGTIEAQVNGGLAPFTYSWNQGGNAAVIENLVEGEYIVTVTDETGCQGETTVNLIDPLLMTSTVNIVDPLCAETNSGTAEITLTGGESPYTYQWNSGQITSQAQNLLEGNYAVNVLDANNCLHSNLATLNDPSAIEVSFTAIASTCGTNDGSITASASGGDNNYVYSWDNMANGSLNAYIESGTYEVTVEDGNGCLLTESFDLVSQVNPIEICVVTVDSLNRNLIAWEKPLANNIAGFYIYRNIAGAYSQIGYQPYDSISQYVDQSFGVDPNVTSYRYKIAALDTCGIESELSNFHETVHLTANQGLGGVINLIWDEYEGFMFAEYNILRDSTGAGDWETIASVLSTSFTYTDAFPPQTSTLDYIIEVVMPATCSATKAQDHNTTRSNRHISDGSGGNSSTSIEESILSSTNIYPNPSSGNFVIQSNNGMIEGFDIIDAYGKIIMKRIMNAEIEEVQLNVEAGIYLVRLKNKNYSLIKRITVW